MGKIEQPATPPQGAPEGGGLPHLVWFLGLHMGIGMALGVIFAALLLLFNIADLKALIGTTEQPVVAIVMLYAMCALTFGSLAMGISIMTLPFDDGDPDEPDGGPEL